MGRVLLLSCAFKGPRVFRTALDASRFKPNARTLKLCAASLQGDGVCNGTHSKKALLSDPQLLEAQFDELLTELTVRDLTDPGLTDALNRLREVRVSLWCSVMWGQVYCFNVGCVGLQVMVYNVPGGKKNRGLSVIGSLRELLPPSQLTQDAVQRALVVGWCIEMVRSYHYSQNKKTLL